MYKRSRLILYRNDRDYALHRRDSLSRRGEYPYAPEVAADFTIRRARLRTRGESVEESQIFLDHRVVALRKDPHPCRRRRCRCRHHPRSRRD